MKNRKGITLIALIITIVILIILAGVAINLTVGENGIFNKAKFAKEKYTNEEYLEQEQLNEIYAYLNKDSKLPENTKDTEMGTQVKLPSEWYSTTPAYISTEDGKTVKDVGVDLEGNQFVWIPCTIENYKKKDFGENYTSAGWNKQNDSAEEVQIEKYSGFYIARYEAGMGEAEIDSPMQAVTAVTNSTYSWGWQSDVYTKEKVSSTAKPTSKANEIPWYHADYFTAVEMSKRMYKGHLTVASGLVTGTMWDVMLQYIASQSEYTSSGTWGNYANSSITLDRGYYTNVTSGNTDGFKKVTEGQTSGTRVSKDSYVLLSTGASDAAKKKNVYDVAGNLWEWTTETSYLITNAKYSKTDFNVNTHMLRSSGFSSVYDLYPSCYRCDFYDANTHTIVGFRVALYIK